MGKAYIERRFCVEDTLKGRKYFEVGDNVYLMTKEGIFVYGELVKFTIKDIIIKIQGGCLKLVKIDAVDGWL